MPAPIAIAGRAIGPGLAPYIIAEISANHGGDFERARRIMREAAMAGADAVKFQLYEPGSLTLDSDRPEFRIGGRSPWAGERLWDLYARAMTPAAWLPALFAEARALGVAAFASVFDQAGIDRLEALDVPAYKIASFEAVDLELIAACAATGKPLILSTGLCTLEDIADAVAAFRAAGGRELVLLRCNSSYPADPAEANLATIPDMMARFDLAIGYSDHTLDAAQAIAAVALGAVVIEKHVIDAREPATADSAFSSLPAEFAALVAGCRAAHAATGRVAYGPTPREAGSIVFRRSLFVTAPIARGDSFSRANLRVVRPGHGLAPRHLPAILGRRAARAIAPGEPLSWDLIDPAGAAPAETEEIDARRRPARS